MQGVVYASRERGRGRSDPAHKGLTAAAWHPQEVRGSWDPSSDGFWPWGRVRCRLVGEMRLLLKGFQMLASGSQAAVDHRAEP